MTMIGNKTVITLLTVVLVVLVVVVICQFSPVVVQPLLRPTHGFKESNNTLRLQRDDVSRQLNLLQVRRYLT